MARVGFLLGADKSAGLALRLRRRERCPSRLAEETATYVTCPAMRGTSMLV